MTDAPDNGKEDCAAAEQIHEDEDVLPAVVAGFALLRLLNDDVGHVGEDLKRQDDDEHSLLFVGQDVLDERPAGADQDNGEK